MDEEKITALVEYLLEKAAILTEEDAEELKTMKKELDEYVAIINSKMPIKTQGTAHEQFEKCRICAREWINVYRDSTYHEGVKADILKEEAMEFFFTMDERIIAVQKNFFMLGMIDEIIKPSKPFSKRQRKAKIANAKIRILAREQGLKANCETRPTTIDGKTEKNRYWYFGDQKNFLQSSESGLTDEQAIDYLLC